MHSVHRCLQALLCAIALYCAPAVAISLDDRADDVFDAGFFPGFVCDLCRDPQQHPEDFAAFAYNAYFGDDPWMWDSQLGIPFRIYDLHLHWVVVWFEGVLFDAPTLLPNLMDIRLRLESGIVVTFTVLQTGPDMPIGERDPGSGQPSAGGDSGGGGGEGDDDYEEADDAADFELDADDYFGSVEIIDANEDGEFPDWEEEL